MRCFPVRLRLARVLLARWSLAGGGSVSFNCGSSPYTITLTSSIVVTTGTSVDGGKPVVRGTHLPIAVILDGMAEGLSADQIIDHYPHLGVEDIHAALAYTAALAQEGIWKIAA